MIKGMMRAKRRMSEHVSDEAKHRRSVNARFAMLLALSVSFGCAPSKEAQSVKQGPMQIGGWTIMPSRPATPEERTATRGRDKLEIQFNRSASEKTYGMGKDITKECLAGGGEKVFSGKMTGCLESHRLKAIFSKAPKRTTVIASLIDSDSCLLAVYRGDQSPADARREIRKILGDFPRVWAKLFE